MKKLLFLTVFSLALLSNSASAQTTPTAFETQVGNACTNSAHSTDFDTLVQCSSTSATAGTMQKAPLFIGAVTAPPYATTDCDASKEGMIQYTGTEVQICDGTSWGSLAGSSPSGGQSMFEGWPDAIVCQSSGTPSIYYHWYADASDVHYYVFPHETTRFTIAYASDGTYSTNGSSSSYDCVTNTWSIADLITNGRAFNFVNGGGGVNEVPVGTAGAPGLYFTGDTNTGIYHPAADTVAVAVAGAEVLRVDSGGSLSFGLADAAADVSLDLSAKTDSMTVPTGTEAQRPATGIAGMLRFNSDAGEFEGYDGTSWGAIGGSSTASGGQSMFDGWPDAIVCDNGASAKIVLNIYFYTSTEVRYLYNYLADWYAIDYNLDGSFKANYQLDTYDCVTSAKSITTLITEGNAFNFVNGGGGVNEVPVGTAGAPGLYFTGDTNTGIYHPAADTVAVAVAGAEVLRVDSGGSLSFGLADAAADVSLDLSAKTDSMTVPTGTEAQRPATGIAGMLRFNSDAGEFEGYDGTEWGAIGGSSGASGGQSMVAGFPDVIKCISSGGWNIEFYHIGFDSGTGYHIYRYIYNEYTNLYQIRYTSAGVYQDNSNLSTYDCVTNAWSISDLISNGRAFNIVNGGGGVNEVPVGTAGAPGLYFTGDENTGIYRPAADTVAVSVAGAEVARFDSGGSLSFGLADAAADVTLDMSAKTDSMTVPTGTELQRPATGIAGMLRFNSDSNEFEGYNGTEWGAIGGSTTASGGQSLTSGWPDVIMCDTGTYNYFLYRNTGSTAGVNHSYRFSPNDGSNYFVLQFNDDGSYLSSSSTLGTTDCVTSTRSISWLATNGRTFNFVNGGGGVNEVPVGTAGAPGLYFTGDTNTGIYHPAADTVAVSVAGAEVARFDAGGSLSFGQADAAADVSLDMSAKTDSMTVPTGTEAQRPATGIAGMLRFNSDSNEFEGYNGTEWGAIGGSGSGASGGQSIFDGFPDAIICVASSGTKRILWIYDHQNTFIRYKHRGTSAGEVVVQYNLDGSYLGNENMPGTDDCIANTRSISYLVSNGLAFNATNGGGGVNEVPVGTAGAPGLYFTGDTNTGIYRPAADTVAVAVAGAEVLRVDSGGSLSFGLADAAADVTLDMSAKTDSMTVPTGTEAQRPATGIAGMLRFNSDAGEFEGYDGTEWGAIGGSSTASGGQSMFEGWPDAIVCNSATQGTIIFMATDMPSNQNGKYTYRWVYTYTISFNADGSYDSTTTPISDATCILSSWSISQYVANGQAFNLTNGGGGVNEVPVGTAGAPGLYFTGDTNTGIYRPAADTVAVSVAGAEVARFDAGGSLSFGLADAAADVSLDLSAKTDSMTVPTGTEAQRPATGIAGMLRFNSDSNEFEGYDGTEWGAIGGSSSGGTGQSMRDGWPDAIVCYRSSGGVYNTYWMIRQDATVTTYRGISNPVSSTDMWIKYNADGSYNSESGTSSPDCVTNSWTIAQLISNGKAFNFVNGGGAAGSMADGTAGAPGLYFTGDANTGIYRPAADTVAVAAGGVEIAKFEAGAMTLPSGAEAARPATGIAGMLRFNSDSNEFEGYNGTEWGAIGGSSSGGTGQSMYDGFPDVIMCESGSSKVYLNIQAVDSSYVEYRLIGNTPSTAYQMTYTLAGTYSSTTNLGSFDCASNSWSIAYLVANGRAFNFTNGGGAAGSMADGTAGAPGLYFADDADTGIYSPAEDTVAISTGGTEAVRVDSAGDVDVTGSVLMGYERKSKVCSNTYMCVISCSSGKVPLGGGCKHVPSPSVAYSYPTSSGWDCRQSPTGSDITAYVICARMGD